MLARSGHAVTLIGRAPHVEAIRRDGLQLRWASGVESVRVTATTELAAAGDADLVLVCVKSADSDAVARELAPLLRADAIVLSLQNGVDNADRLAGQRVFAGGEPLAPVRRELQDAGPLSAGRRG